MMRSSAAASGTFLMVMRVKPRLAKDIAPEVSRPMLATSAKGSACEAPVARATISSCGLSQSRPRAGPHEWSGLLLLTDVRGGSFCIQQLPYAAVMERWGEGAYAQELRADRMRGRAERSMTDEQVRSAMDSAARELIDALTEGWFEQPRGPEFRRRNARWAFCIRAMERRSITHGVEQIVERKREISRRMRENNM